MSASTASDIGGELAGVTAARQLSLHYEALSKVMTGSWLCVLHDVGCADTVVDRRRRRRGREEPQRLRHHRFHIHSSQPPRPVLAGVG